MGIVRLEIQIIKGKATVIGRMNFLGMVTILGMVSVIGMVVLRMVNVLVMMRAAIWTSLFKELYLMLISKIWDTQTNTTVNGSSGPGRGKSWTNVTFF